MWKCSLLSVPFSGLLRAGRYQSQPLLLSQSPFPWQKHGSTSQALSPYHLRTRLSKGTCFIFISYAGCEWGCICVCVLQEPVEFYIFRTVKFTFGNIPNRALFSEFWRFSNSMSLVQVFCSSIASLVHRICVCKCLSQFYCAVKSAHFWLSGLYVLKCCGTLKSLAAAVLH